MPGPQAWGNKNAQKYPDLTEEEKENMAKLEKLDMKSIPKKRKENYNAFLDAYALVGTITTAARIANANSSHVRAKLRDDPVFKAEFDDKHEEFVNYMEAECYRRAVEGTRVPVIHKGEIVRVWVDKHGNIVLPDDPTAHKEVPLMEHKKSDLLMMFALKALKPDMYRENQKIDLTTGNKPIKAYVGVDIGAV